MFLGLLFCCACSPKSDKPSETCIEGGEERSFLFRAIQFSEMENGLLNGFDLDGRNSGANDPNGCFQEDATDALGNVGIDNSIGQTLHEFQASEIGAIGSYLQQTVVNGNLLIMLRATGIDDLENDECIQVEMLRAQGPALLDLNNRFLDGQTLARHPDFPPGETVEGRIEDGILTAEGLDIALQILVDVFEYPFTVEDASIRIDLTSDNGMVGHFGGTGPVEDYYLISDFDQTSYTDFIKQRIKDRADMAPDENGICQRISTSFDIEAISSHLYVE